MKITVMSDTHLHYVTDAFEAICHRYCDHADMVIHLGDMVRGPVLDFLERYPLQAVAGNTDDYSIHSRLPSKRVIQAEGFRIGIIHGWGASANLRSKLHREFSDVDAILFGHSHEALQATEDGVFLFNPGSVFMGRGGSPSSIGILHVDGSLRGEIIPL